MIRFTNREVPGSIASVLAKICSTVEEELQELNSLTKAQIPPFNEDLGG